jgi:hypothetical protein
MAECRIGWLPFLFSWMDRQYLMRPPDRTVSLRGPPSEYVRRNVRFTFEDDTVGARLLELDPGPLRETVMWGCDYPHPQGVWPSPQPVLERLLGRVDPALRHEILFGRAARLFRIEAEQVSTGTG